MIAEFILTVLYSQLNVTVPGAAATGLLWTDDHVAQGFAWSPGFVSLGVPDHDGQVRVSVQCSDTFQADIDTLWAVQTPLDVNASPIAIGTVGNAQAVAVPIGRYNLVFEGRVPTGGVIGDIAYDLRLHLVETSTASFAILKQGNELETDEVLSERAEPV